ncbi:MAG: hypothetical protein R2695_05890 [Acidimicrobiales bacterium]
MSDHLGIDQVTATRVLGVGLLVFAAVVWVTAGAPEPRLLRDAAAVSAADASWVIATAVVLTAGVLNTTGTVVAVLVAIGVADFGIAQWWLRSRAVGADRTATLAG